MLILPTLPKLVVPVINKLLTVNKLLELLNVKLLLAPNCPLLLYWTWVLLPAMAIVTNGSPLA